MFEKRLNSYDIEYNSNNPASKIRSIKFSWGFGMRLLQVFGTFDNQPTLHSFDQGVLGDIGVTSIHIKVSCNEISAEKLDLILDELERIEPEFTTTKHELRTIIQEKMAQPVPPVAESARSECFGIRREDAEKIASAHHTLALLTQSIFNQHGIRRTSEENDFQKARRLLTAGQYQAALTCIRRQLS